MKDIVGSIANVGELLLSENHLQKAVTMMLLFPEHSVTKTEYVTRHSGSGRYLLEKPT